MSSLCHSQVHSGAQTSPVLHGADAHQVPMLDGVYVDIVGNAVLPAVARLRRSGVRTGRSGMHARLARYGGIFGDAVHTGAGAQSHHYSVHVRVHLRCDQAAATGFSSARQGKYCTVRLRIALNFHATIRTALS